MLKRFLLFAYDQYYPAGGWADFQESFDSPEELQEFAQENCANYDCIEAVDTDNGATWDVDVDKGK